MARPSALPNAPTLPLSYAYASNQANQRTRMGLADGSYWVYQYDQLGPVISGRRFWTDGTPVVGQQFEYGFDDIGNRTSTGDRESAESTYTVNVLNQYEDRTVAGDIDVFGITNPTDDVTVNAVDADRQGEYFHRTVPVTNTSAAQYSAITVVSEYSGTQTTTGAVFVAKRPEVFTPDDDGNLIQDGRWDYVWDGENRLAKMRSLSGSPAPERRIEFEYDWQGRRIRKTVYDDRDDAQGSVVSDTVFLYDGWNLIAELDADNSNNEIRTYVWGNDLSGSMQGAGGVGGLLKVVNHGDSTQHFVAYDGNGNVMGLVDASNGTISARYEYGPFAAPLRASGDQAANPFRFSTKYCDGESGLYYYGRRYYVPSTGRWLNRDPIGEAGGFALYGFLANSPCQTVDHLGLASTGGVALVAGAALIITAAIIYDACSPETNPMGIELDVRQDVVHVKTCQIIIYPSHNTKKKPKVTFEFENRYCSAAGFVGCWPVNVNEKIPLPALLPGAPMHDDLMVVVDPSELACFDPDDSNKTGLSKRMKDKYIALEKAHENPRLDAYNVLDELIASAWKRASGLCKGGCCSEVEIIMWNQDAGVDILPATFRIVKPCK